MKTEQLEELIRGIVRHVLKEYTSSMSSSDIKTVVGNNPDLDTTTPPEDAMTTAEKARIDREKELDRQKQIKQKQVELDSERKQTDFYKRKVDQSKRFDIPNITKDIQRLKGADI